MTELFILPLDCTELVRALGNVHGQAVPDKASGWVTARPGTLRDGTARTHPGAQRTPSLSDSSAAAGAVVSLAEKQGSEDRCEGEQPQIQTSELRESSRIHHPGKTRPVFSASQEDCILLCEKILHFCFLKILFRRCCIPSSKQVKAKQELPDVRDVNSCDMGTGAQTHCSCPRPCFLPTDSPARTCQNQKPVSTDSVIPTLLPGPRKSGWHAQRHSTYSELHLQSVRLCLKVKIKAARSWNLYRGLSWWSSG